MHTAQTAKQQRIPKHLQMWLLPETAPQNDDKKCESNNAELNTKQ